METHSIHPDNKYKDHNTLSRNRDVSIKKDSAPSEASQTYDHLKKTSSPITLDHVGTKVAFSIENDLHIIVTTVKESNTNTVIRQIPSEETIDRLRFLNRYYK